jgi:hypothetical protein
MVVTLAVLAAPPSRADQIFLAGGAVDMSAEPFFDSDFQRNEFANSFDRDLGTQSFLTRSGPGAEPRIVAYSFASGLQSFNRIRINEVAGNDNNGPVLLTVYYYDGDSEAAFIDREYKPVTGLELVEVDDEDEIPEGEVFGENEFERFDVENDGYFSLQFDEVQASGFAIEFDTAGGNTHYHVREIEAHFGPTAPVVFGQIAIDDGALDLSADPAFDDNGFERDEFDNSFDGNVETRSFLTKSGPGPGPRIAVYKFQDGLRPFNRIRINEVANNDGNGPVTLDLLYYDGDPGVPFLERSYKPVTGLALVQADEGDGLPAGTVSGNTFARQDVSHDGYFSLQFTEVPASGFAMVFDTAGGNTHYHVREIEAHLGERVQPVAPGQITLDDGAVDMSADPFFDSDIQRNEFANSFDRDLRTQSFLTRSGPGPDPRIVAYNFESGLQPFNRIRINEVSNNDTNGPVTLTVYYYDGDSGTDFLDRSYKPVTGLVVVEVDDGDAIPGGEVTDNTFRHFDVSNDGYYSLQFDEVQASGFALVFDTTGGNTHYHVREIEAHFGTSVTKPNPVTDQKIDIVRGVVTPGPQRDAAGSEFELAFDDDVNTRTFTTNSGTQTAPQKSRLGFEEGSRILTRIRINDIAGNDTNGRMVQITVRVTTGDDPDLNARTYTDVTNLAVNLFEGDADPLPNVVLNGNTIEHLDANHDGFYSIDFDPVPGATGIELEWENEGRFKHWTIREIEAYGKPDLIPVTNTIINIVDGLVDPGPQRDAAGSEFELAYDGDVETRTFTTSSGTQEVPQRSLLALEDGIHNLSRIRINDVAGNDNNGRMTQITIRVTTDSDDDLAARTYTDVTNLSVQHFEGDADPLPNVNVTGNTIEHLDTRHDGFYSVVFDPVPGATGIEFEWENEGPFKHWTIREIEAYSGAPASFQITELSFNENGKPVITWESRANLNYIVELSLDLIEWFELNDNVPGDAGTTSFTHEGFVDGTAELYYRVQQ